RGGYGQRKEDEEEVATIALMLGGRGGYGQRKEDEEEVATIALVRKWMSVKVME
nr:hypothetical protein [Tanacetum cinerariifolium]